MLLSVSSSGKFYVNEAECWTARCPGDVYAAEVSKSHIVGGITSTLSFIDSEESFIS
jgi:hypothetical protein